MSIVSTVVEQYPQPGGDIDVVERHTDHLGNQYMRVWRASGHDIPTKATEHAAELEAQLAQQEIDGILG